MTSNTTKTAETVLAYAKEHGREWTAESTGETRYYLNEYDHLLEGVEMVRYGTGNVKRHFVDGEKRSNNSAYSRWLGFRVWVDAEGQVHAERFGGTSDEVAERVTRGILTKGE